MKPALLSFFILFVSPAFAQDTIITRNGAIISAQVKVVGKQSVLYRRFNHPVGREHLIDKKEVNRIKFHNGTELVLNVANDPIGIHDSSRENQIKANPLSNMLVFAPLQVMGEGMGISLAYEKMLDNKKALCLPLMVIYNLEEINDVYHITNKPAFYFNPGLKFYPASHNGAIRYSIGPSIALAYSKYDPSLDYLSPAEHSYFLFGALISNALNVYLHNNWYLGVELGLGWSIYSQQDYYPGTNFLFQFSLKTGIRF